MADSLVAEKSNAQISKLIGEQWHKMDAEKKKAYVEQAEKIKEVCSIRFCL
jgi:hypothetical protein